MKMDSKLRGRDKFRKYRVIIRIISNVYRIFPPKIRIKLLNSHRKTNGSIGLVLRYALLKTIASQIGDNVAIFPDVYISNPDNLSIGNNVSIHPMCYIEAHGGVHIGNDVSIAHGTTIMSENHIFQDISKPIKEQGIECRPIMIHDNVWIGAKATILAGNTIESGAIVAAGAVVTKDVDENCIVSGVPARLLRKRTEF